ncbi:NYN domain-containing protein OS=Lysinibacillus sphaericus OX=1421 GN=LS41612_01020 PE=4 SV=1 [Lysinibacillus sphaericus]
MKQQIERIEKMTQELKKQDIFKFTWRLPIWLNKVLFFGNGALRKSARELEIDLSIIQHKISHDVKRKQDSKPPSRIELKPDVALAFEKWRRGLK